MPDHDPARRAGGEDEHPERPEDQPQINPPETEPPRIDPPREPGQPPEPQEPPPPGPEPLQLGRAADAA